MRLLLSALATAVFLSACVVLEEDESSPLWQVYYSSETATAFIDGRIVLNDEGLRRTSILINYEQSDEIGTQSATLPLLVDCEGKRVRIERFIAYSQLYGMGELIKDDDNYMEESLSLDDFFNGDKVYELVCYKPINNSNAEL